MHVVTGSNNSALGSDDEINELNELLDDLTREERDIKGQLEWLESRGKKRKRQVETWLNQVQVLKNKAGDIVKYRPELQQDWIEVCTGPLGLNYGHEKQQLTTEVREHKEQKPLVLSNELVGKSFEENVKKIWELLGKTESSLLAYME